MGHPGQLPASHHADYRQSGSGIHRSASLATPQINPKINPVFWYGYRAPDRTTTVDALRARPADLSPLPAIWRAG
ncbi:hypothetical protein GCM10010109_45730 [Actinoplanes campanulatus]|nr:hypothetical protein GCM10010109_45730 [Actinoplanes campanulatus]GID37934.1 hypothetical protein Aca09nite_44400 [Actinoplanes campanulatus]